MSAAACLSALQARSEALASMNTQALARRGLDLMGALDAWRDHARSRDMREEEGRLVRRGADGVWRGGADEAREVASYTLPYLNDRGEVDPARAVKPIIVEGVTCPDLLERVWATTPRIADGYQPMILVVQEDAVELMDGLSRRDLRGVIADERVRWFVGAGASALLRAFLAERLHVALPADYLRSPGLGRAASPDLIEVVRGLHRAQQEEHARLSDAMRAIYSGRDVEWWRERWASALDGRGEPLRLLIPVSRYSTFVKHSASDLASALEGLGCEARLLSEPDAHSRLVSVAYLREMASWKPDAVMVINHARRHLAAMMPSEVPFITWIQDRLPILFDEAVGRSMGPLDFTVGHLHCDLSYRFAWPTERRRFWYVPASARKFGVAAPTSRGAGDRFAGVDIAFVSHQSEPPETQHAALRARLPSAGGMQRAADMIFDRLRAAAERGDDAWLGSREVAPSVFADIGIDDPDRRKRYALEANYVLPMVERVVRHAVLEWAAEAARRRGWTLRLFGQGWERHPRLSAFAAGAIKHDIELSACYRAARCHLHISTNTNAHQRVYECALAGGLMLRRGPSPDSEAARWGVWARVLDARGLWEREIEDRVEFEESSVGLDAAVLEQVGARRVRSGTWALDTDASVRLGARTRRAAPPLRMLPDLMMPRARETLFIDRAGLEALAGRAIEDEGWRRAVIDAQSGWVRAEATYEALGSDLLRFVSAELGCGTVLQGTPAECR